MDPSDNAHDLAVNVVRPAVDTLSTDKIPSHQTSNPWAEQADVADLPKRPISTPDPSVFEGTLAATEGPILASSLDEDKRLRVSEDVLNEFDPLADREEIDARVAWSQAESHPPTSPPATPADNLAKPPQQLDSPPSPTAPSTFPSLASLARTFGLPRSRPLSVDAPPNVLSPASLSAFASQQRARPLDDVERPGESSRNASPHPGREREKDKVPQFDFQKFLDQMKMKGAEAVAKYLRSFLSNFAKRTFTLNDQVKLINDFLNFISARMRESDVWRNASEPEFDNAMEAMEKLVMNRLYDFTFTPQIVNVSPPRPVTTDDLERDRVLSQRIALFEWIQEKHLDVPEGEGSKGFLDFAQQELLKVNHYKAPRDKLICILNCCKVIFGLIRHMHSEEGADSFVPILIFVVIKANPPYLLSNVEYINRFRNPQKLQSEAGYYFSSLMGAVSFIETMDHTSLSNITPEEFEKNVEEAIHSLPEIAPQQGQPPQGRPSTPSDVSQTTPPTSPHAGEESAQPLSLPAPGQGGSLADDTRRLLQKTGDTISKPLNALGRIFSEALDGAEGRLTYLPGPFAPFEMGRENRQEREREHEHEHAVPGHWAHPDEVAWFAEGGVGSALPHTPVGLGGSAQQEGSYNPPVQTPYRPRVRPFVTSPGSVQSAGSFGQTPESTPTRGGLGPPHTHQPLSFGSSLPLPAHIQASPHPSRTPTPSLDIVGLQAEIDRAHEKAAAAAQGTLVQIFPGVDREVIEWVLEANNGDLGKSIEALLEISTEG